MTPKEQFEACMKLADYSAGRHNARRDYEWKVSLGLWAALFASAPALKGIQLPIWTIWLVPTFYAIFWLRGLSIANANDKSLTEHFRTEAEKIARDPKSIAISAGPKKLGGLRSQLRFVTDWVMQFHFMATLGISWIVWTYAVGAMNNC